MGTNEVSVRENFSNTLQTMKEKKVLTSCVSVPKINDSKKDCVQDSPSVVAWEMEDFDEMRCFVFEKHSFANNEESGTIVRFVNDEYVTPYERWFYISSVVFLASFALSLILAMTGAASLAVAALISAPAALSLAVSNAKAIQEKTWSKKNPSKSILPKEELVYFPSWSKVPQLLQMNENVAQLVKTKISVSSSRKELDEWASMANEIFSFQKNFPHDLIPMENSDIETLLTGFRVREKELKVEWDKQFAIEDSSRKNESTITLEGAMSMVNQLGVDDFDHKWQK